jgi:hypothetical protein
VVIRIVSIEQRHPIGDRLARVRRRRGLTQMNARLARMLS